MKKVIILSATSIAVTTFAACNGSSSAKPATTDSTSMNPTMDSTKMSAMDTTKNTMTASVKYTCTMHPEIVSDKPGKCPKCGMDLVPMKSAMKDSMSMKHDSTMKMN